MRHPMLNVAVSVIAMATALTACGSEPTASEPVQAGAASESGTFTLLAQSDANEQTAFAEIVTEFQKAYPEIKIKAEYAPLGPTYVQTLRTRLQAGNPPDVFYVTPGSGGQQAVLPFAEAGYLADLSNQPWSNGVIPQGSHDLFYTGSQLWAAPLDQVVVAQVYNVEAMREVGLEAPPKTLDEVKNACALASAKGKALYALGGANNQTAGMFVSSLAATQVLPANPDWNSERAAGRVTFADSPEWKATLQSLLDMMDWGCFQEGAEGADIAQFAPLVPSGKTLGAIIPVSSIASFKAVNPDVALRAYPVPTPNAGQQVLYSYPGNAVALSAKASGNGAALKFLEFFAVGEGSALYAAQSGGISLQEAQGKAPLSNPDLAPLQDLLKDDSRAFPLVQAAWPNSEVYEQLGNGVQGLLIGQQRPEDVLAAMDAAWNR
ncbi:raffinose/stachyose/melibiose transport system substrate-binding protein [Actinocorallia herbida]|uniref:Raffinose/stachyose/melibiose transport system substrate-binding protein n=1 Tax=Actinocorallia herbida TaxID=58109 RepID=A0A3N1D3F9_9ACTN|nr:extracellular solute-binding protein [Actinocorallia herbida]ROO88061.1 raffinose/stachyose/melibiose transport system substrate-binding protein [Actinocorallia herbida]